MPIDDIKAQFFVDAADATPPSEPVPLTFEDCITIHDARGFALVERFGSFRGSEFEPGVMSSSIHVFGRI